MRTTTRTHRAALVMSGAIAALVVGGATAPAAHAQPGDKAPANHGKKVGHSKKANPGKKANSSNKAGPSRAGQSQAASGQSNGSASSGASNRASSNKDGQGHNDQWQAQSDPDGMENGGIDQPGGNGGYDPKGWDGNNGTGNDPDCEDDNRGKGVPGHCKSKPAQPAKAEKPEKSEQSEQSEQPELPTVLGIEKRTITKAGGSTVVVQTGAEVLGVEQFAPTSGRAPVAKTASTDASGTALPNTGADAAMLTMLAGGLATAGAGAVLVRRGRASHR